MVENQKGQDQVKQTNAATDPNEIQWEVLGSKFTLPKRYKVIAPIGSGAYGIVVCAQDKEIEETEEQANVIAIKKIEKAFEHKIYTLRTLRELKIMRLLDHENVLRPKTILQPKNL